MIASVVATLHESGDGVRDVTARIAQIPNVEVGDVGNDARRIPITIDSADPNALEDITRRLQACHGVAFVDVVFVHFEDESGIAAATGSGETNSP